MTRLTNAARLRMKESDRLTSITAALNALGANILGFSEKQPTMDWLARALGDNPLGQGEECTPMGILRKA